MTGSSETPTMVVYGHVITFGDTRPPETLVGDEAYLNHKKQCNPQVLGGTKQQETIKFRVVGGPITGIKMVKKVKKGVIGPFEEVVEMGDYEPGEHEFALAASEVPGNMFSRGQYTTDLKFLDCSGHILWENKSQFAIIKPPGSAAAMEAHVPCPCFARSN